MATGEFCRHLHVWPDYTGLAFRPSQSRVSYSLSTVRLVVRPMKPAYSLMFLLAMVVLGAHQLRAEGLVGRTIGDFELKDWQGQPYRVSDHVEDKAIVVAFLGIECPMAKAYASRLVELEREFRDRGVSVIAIDANEQDSLSELGQFAREYEIAFPLLKDHGQTVADLFGAERTPEFFVLDRERVIRYHGRFDDQYGVGYQRPEVRRRDLVLALGEVLADRTVTVAETKAPGCLIGRLREARDDAPVTWVNQISRLVQQHCQECHRPNSIGPFSLTEYDEAVGWAGMIAEVVLEERMPPWHASPEHGEFSNDARLTQEEKELFARWVADGAPEGDLSQLPPPRTFREGWSIGEPDLVIHNSEEYEKIPATGIVDYRYYVVDPGFRETQWIRAVEVRPECPAVVHHVSVYLQTPGDSFATAFRNIFSGFQPGATFRELPEQAAFCIPAGTRFVFQVHYTPCGIPKEDRIAMGLKFADPKKVTRQCLMFLVKNDSFVIPPGVQDYKVEAMNELGVDVDLVALVPHMHLRGKRFLFEAEYPDGRRETLLDVPKWDFNWQHAYSLTQPKHIPKGSRIRTIAYYDNSAENAANPDPTVPVEFGHQVWDEMMDGYVAVAVPVDPATMKTTAPKKPAAASGTAAAGDAFQSPRWPWVLFAAIPLVALVVAGYERRRTKNQAIVPPIEQDPAAEVAPSSATAAGAAAKPGRGGLSLLLLVLLGTLAPAWILFDTHRAVQGGWQPSVPVTATTVVTMAWIMLLASWATLLIAPLRHALRRVANSMLSLAILALVLLAIFGWRDGNSPEASSAHLHEANRTQASTFGPAAFWGSAKTATAHYNSQGVRGRELPPSDDAQRILCLGGSSTEVPYLDDAQTWPAVLERQLDEQAGQKFWVGNAGKTELTTADHLRFLETSPLPRSSDTLVVMVGMDDLWHTLTARTIAEPAAPAWYDSQVAANLLRTNDPSQDADDTQTSQSDFWARRRDPAFPPQPERPPDFDRAVAEYEQRIRAIAEWGRRHDVQIVFVTQPVLWDAGVSHAARKRLSIAQVMPHGKEWTFLSADRLRPLIDRYNDVLRTVSRETSSECIDLAAELSGKEFFFEDDYHFNAEGCRRAARLLAERLGRQPAVARN